MSKRNIWDKLYAKIKNPYGVAGLMGNLRAESNFISTNLQTSYEKSLNMTDDTYTNGVDNGTYNNFVNDKAGYGLAQWTSAGRKQGLLNYAKSKKKSIGDEDMQIEYLLYELEIAYKSVMSALINAKSIKEASDIVLTKFERPRDQSDRMKEKRAGYGLEVFKEFTSTPVVKKYYRVQVGAFKTKANATKLQKKLINAGFQAIIKDGDGLFRCQVGAFSVKANATSSLNTLKAAGFKDAFIAYS